MIRSSVIIPTSGRPIAIKSAILSILATTPENFDAEIIVVDNNTDENLASDLYSYCQSMAGRIRYCREYSPGLSAARHRGASEARSDLLTFIDDDVEVSATWLPAIQKAFSDSEVAMVGGPSIPKFTCSIPSWFWDYFSPTAYGGWMCSWLSLLDIGKDISCIDPNYIWGLNFSIRKSVLESCGGFHHDLVPSQFIRWQGNGETGLTMKIQAAGYRADYIQDAMLFHLCSADRLNVDYFKKRAYYQGVCDSFTSIRNGNKPLISSKEPPLRQIKSMLLRIHNRAWRPWRTFKSKNRKENLSPWAVQAISIKQLTEEAYREGWQFHQREVANDPALLAWVRRKDYLGTDLRENLAI